MREEGRWEPSAVHGNECSLARSQSSLGWMDVGVGKNETVEGGKPLSVLLTEHRHRRRRRLSIVLFV